jgi:thioredoxin reductase (NADPH)
LSEKIDCPKCNLKLNTQTKIEKHPTETGETSLSAPILEVNSEEWEKTVLKSDMLLVVEFWHQNCPACKDFAPIYKKATHEFGNKLKFLKLDVLKSTDNRNLAVSYGLTSTPTLVFFCKGKAIATKEDREGFETEEQFRKLLNTMIKICS